MYLFSAPPSDSESVDTSYDLLTSDCRSVLQCVSKDPMYQEIYKFLSCNSTKLLPFLAKNSPWCGWDYCHATFESKSIGSPWQPEGFYASLFGGSVVLHALCHYLKPITEGCDPSCWAMNNTLHQVEDYINISFGGDNLTVAETSASVADNNEGLLVYSFPKCSSRNRVLFKKI